MTLYELVIVWNTGDKDIYEYDTEEEAEQAGRNMQFVFGKQVEWYGTRKKRR